MAAYVVVGTLTGSAYALLAVGFVLVYKGTRVFNLAHGEIGGVGLFAAWALLGVMPVVPASLLGIAVAAAIGLGMERTLIRRLVDRAPLAVLASTLGAGLTFAYIEGHIWGFTIKTFPSPVGRASFELGTVTVTAPRLAALAAAGAVAIGLGIFLRRTRFGLAVWAATSDQELARLSGVPVERVRAFVWALAGGLSGVAAILLATVFTFHPFSSTLVLIRAIAAALLGGLVSLPGAFVGGLAIGLVESVVVSQTNIAGMTDGATFLLILLVLLLRPGGLFGARQAV